MQFAVLVIYVFVQNLLAPACGLISVKGTARRTGVQLGEVSAHILDLVAQTCPCWGHKAAEQKKMNSFWRKGDRNKLT